MDRPYPGSANEVINAKENEGLGSALDKLRTMLDGGELRGLVITALMTNGGVGTVRSVEGLNIAEVVGALDLSKHAIMSAVNIT